MFRATRRRKVVRSVSDTARDLATLAALLARGGAAGGSPAVEYVVDPDGKDVGVGRGGEEWGAVPDGILPAEAVARDGRGYGVVAVLATRAGEPGTGSHIRIERDSFFYFTFFS